MFVCLMIETPELCAELDAILRAHDIDTASSDSVTDAEYVLRGRQPDLMLIQQSRSWFGGDHLLGVLREHAFFSNIPVVVVGNADEVMEVVALTLGADEYITWPCSPGILMARLRSIMRLRRTNRTITESVTLGPVSINVDANTVMKEGRTLSLNRAEFELLKQIVSNGETVTRRSELAKAVLGDDADPRDRRIDVHVSTLRKKLGESRNWLRTVRAIGFAWRDPAAGQRTTRPTAHEEAS